MPKKRNATGSTIVHGYEFMTEHFHNCRKLGENDCIEWTGAKHRQGYGFIAAWDHEIDKKRMITVHRLMAMIKENRRIPSSEMVIHDCGNMACMNPKHLKTGTRSDLNKTIIRNNQAKKTKTDPKI